MTQTSTPSDASDKPKLIVHYRGPNEPNLVWPAGVEPLPVEFVDDDAAESFVMEYADVKVYQCFKDEYRGEVQGWSEHWVSTDPMTDWESEHAFDLRDLPDFPDELAEKYRALFPTPDGNYDAKMHDRRCLAYAIDQGWLTAEGYTAPEEEKPTA